MFQCRFSYFSLSSNCYLCLGFWKKPHLTIQFVIHSREQCATKWTKNKYLHTERTTKTIWKSIKPLKLSMVGKGERIHDLMVAMYCRLSKVNCLIWLKNLDEQYKYFICFPKAGLLVPLSPSNLSLHKLFLSLLLSSFFLSFYFSFLFILILSVFYFPMENSTIYFHNQKN